MLRRWTRIVPNEASGVILSPGAWDRFAGFAWRGAGIQCSRPNEQWSSELHHGPWACQASCCSPAPTQVLTSAASSCLRDASAMTSAVTTAVVLVNAAACRVWSPLLLSKVQLANVVFAGSGLTQRQMWNGDTNGHASTAAYKLAGPGRRV